MANVNFSLAHFNAIAAGHYNAGDVVIRTDQQGNAVLDKVNNHVTKTPSPWAATPPTRSTSACSGRRPGRSPVQQQRPGQRRKHPLRRAPLDA